MYPISKDEPIVLRELAAPGSGLGLVAKIPEGMRAISLRSDEVVGVAGFLLPGTRVDVLVTFRTGNSPDPTTATVVQDVEVLAAGHQIQPDPEGKPSSVDVVTLLLDPANAQKVVLASTQGTVHFVLRNGADRVQSGNLPVTVSQLTSTPVVAPVAPNRPHPARSIGKPYMVETILGTKKLSTSVD